MDRKYKINEHSLKMTLNQKQLDKLKEIADANGYTNFYSLADDLLHAYISKNRSSLLRSAVEYQKTSYAYVQLSTKNYKAIDTFCKANEIGKKLYLQLIMKEILSNVKKNEIETIPERKTTPEGPFTEEESRLLYESLS
jgi:hypothetical protein